MYIRTQVRGSNQYGGKGRLMDSRVCPHCLHIVSTMEYGISAAGFPEKIKQTKCSVCKKDFEPEKKEEVPTVSFKGKERNEHKQFEKGTK